MPVLSTGTAVARTASRRTAPRSARERSVGDRRAPCARPADARPRRRRLPTSHPRRAPPNSDARARARPLHEAPHGAVQDAVGDQCLLRVRVRRAAGQRAHGGVGVDGDAVLLQQVVRDHLPSASSPPIVHEHQQRGRRRLMKPLSASNSSTENFARGAPSTRMSTPCSVCSEISSFSAPGRNDARRRRNHSLVHAVGRDDGGAFRLCTARRPRRARSRGLRHRAALGRVVERRLSCRSAAHGLRRGKREAPFGVSRGQRTRRRSRRGKTESPTTA